MRPLGFSTGALAKGDFLQGIQLQAGRADAVELSALREAELDLLARALPDLELDGFRYVSFHAPSQRVSLSEQELVDRLCKMAQFVEAIIVHPDLIECPEKWAILGDSLLLENMDQRKPIGRTAAELQRSFADLPEARFCFDIGHAHQVDPTLSIAVEMLRMFGSRLAEVHISEVDAASNHVAISSAAMTSYARIASLIPSAIPAIIESVIHSDAIDGEFKMARLALRDEVAAETAWR